MKIPNRHDSGSLVLESTHSYLSISFSGGMALEPENKAGMAHQLEHVLLAPLDEGPWYASAIEDLGGVIEAQTRRDHIRVRLAASNETFGKCAAILISHLANTSRKADEYEHQKAIIESEIAFKLDNGRMSPWPWGVQAYIYDAWSYAHEAYLVDASMLSNDDWTAYRDVFLDLKNATFSLVAGNIDVAADFERVLGEAGLLDRNGASLASFQNHALRSPEFSTEHLAETSRCGYLPLRGGAAEQLDWAVAATALASALQVQSGQRVGGQWGLFDEILSERSPTHFLLYSTDAFSAYSVTEDEFASQLSLARERLVEKIRTASTRGYRLAAWRGWLSTQGHDPSEILEWVGNDMRVPTLDDVLNSFKNLALPGDLP